MTKLKDFLENFIVIPETIRIDGLLLYFLGMVYYTYIHRKHDADMVKGLKGENGLWEAPEAVVYYWLQGFPFILFADAFLGLRLSEGMMWSFNAILFFSIMGRAGVEMMLAWKAKIASSLMTPKEEPKKEEPPL